MNFAIKLISLLFWLLFIPFVGLILITSASSRPTQYLPFRSYIVQTGSMEPTIMPGDLIFIKPQPAYSYQDIVTFVDTAGHTITHRIIKVANKNGTTSFTTKGDNNKTEDTEAITQSQIIGKYQTRLPRAGYLLINMQRPLGTVLIILLPLVVVFAPELLKEKQPTHDKKP